MGAPGGFYSAPSQMSFSSPCRMRWQPRPPHLQTLRMRTFVIHHQTGGCSTETGEVPGKTSLVRGSRIKTSYGDSVVVLTALSRSRSRPGEVSCQESYRRRRNKLAEKELHHISEKLSHRLTELDQVCVLFEGDINSMCSST